MGVEIVGAGFSGLTLAYYLNRAGARVRLWERAPTVGGLIHSEQTKYGLVESAANSLRSSALLEELATTVGVGLCPPKRESRNRYIYRGRPRRWPLALPETLGLAARLCRAYLARSLRPRSAESVAQWARRVMGEAGLRYLLAPALQGIYCADPAHLSAELVLGKLFTKPKRAQGGIVAPAAGMGELLGALRSYLESRGVEFACSQEYTLPLGEERPTFICTAAPDAAALLASALPAASAALARLQLLPLLSVTVFFARGPAKYPGFGCLFPPEEGFRAKGVLFNEDIFPGRSPMRSETWIFGGELDPQVVRLSPSELSAVIAVERSRLFGSTEAPLAIHPHYWERAIPLYDLALRDFITGDCLPSLAKKRIWLHGNYLGEIGLGAIVARSERLAREARWQA